MNPLKMFFVGVGSTLLLIAGIIVCGLPDISVVLCLILALALGFAVGSVVEWIHEEKRMDAWENNYKKSEAYNRMYIQWLSLKQEGKNLAEYLEFNGYKNIAVYGMSAPGERLIEELEDTDIEIRYVVDRNADHIVTRLPKYKTDDNLPEVDVMVVTAIIAFQDIQDEMEKKVPFPIISLEDMIYGMA